ncbi:hypothetical protein PoB_000158600 [Plakobranchus ocellatus]|uniref:DDE Tnp4 domain-containing protein n=1 Tax=Plakobranchus ocellatus TaxID=259542 RepID=A0AAV3X3F3_9GAST|nr:hypothetical protein PoB_000158600 [Plakobranchus ocellatus]
MRLSFCVIHTPCFGALVHTCVHVNNYHSQGDNIKDLITSSCSLHTRQLANKDEFLALDRGYFHADPVSLFDRSLWE